MNIFGNFISLPSTVLIYFIIFKIIIYALIIFIKNTEGGGFFYFTFSNFYKIKNIQFYFLSLYLPFLFSIFSPFIFISREKTIYKIYILYRDYQFFRLEYFLFFRFFIVRFFNGRFRFCDLILRIFRLRDFPPLYPLGSLCLACSSCLVTKSFLF